MLLFEKKVSSGLGWIGLCCVTGLSLMCEAVQVYMANDIMMASIHMNMYPGA